MFDTLSRWKRKASSYSPFSSSGTNQPTKTKKTSNPLHVTNPDLLDVEASASGLASGSASQTTLRANSNSTAVPLISHNHNRRIDIQNLTISQPYPRASPSFSGTIPYQSTGNGNSGGNGTGQLGGHEFPFPIVMGGMNFGSGSGSGFGHNTNTTTTTPTYTPQMPTPYWQNQSLYHAGTGTLQQQHQQQLNETGNELGTPPSQWVNAIVDSLEDNRPMGTLGRRRGHGYDTTSGVGNEVDGNESNPIHGVVGNKGYGAPAVVRLDSNSSSYQENRNTGVGIGDMQYYQGQDGGYGYGHQQPLGNVHQKGSLRLQTNVIPGQPPGNAYYEQLRLLQQQFQQFQVQQLHGGSVPQTPLQGPHQQLQQQQQHQPDLNVHTNPGQNSYSYELPTHLSPIEEKDYFSPVDSIRNARSLIGSIRGITAGRRSSSGNVNGSGNEDRATITGTTGTTTRSGTGDSSNFSGGGGSRIASRTGTGDSFPGSSAESKFNIGIGSRVGSRESTSTNVNFAGMERGIGSGGDMNYGSTPITGTPQLQGSPYPGRNTSPVGSISVSDGIRPSLAGPNPLPSPPTFLTRQLNRTLSQTSSRTHTSNGTSSTPAIGSNSGPNPTSITTITSPTTNSNYSPIPSVGIPSYIRQSQSTITSSSKTQTQTQTQTQNQNQTPTTPTPTSTTHTHTSITSSTVHTIATGTGTTTTLVGSNPSDQPPMIPPLDLRPHFPGPHPSYNGTGPPLRIRHGYGYGYGYGVGVGKVKVKRASVPASIMPKIPGSHEGYYDEEGDDVDSYKEEEYDDDEEEEEEEEEIEEEEEEEDDLEMMMYESGMTLTDGQASLHAESYINTTRSLDDRCQDNGIDGKETIRYGDEVRGRYWRKGEKQGEETPNAIAGSSKVVLGRTSDDYVDGADIEAGVSGLILDPLNQQQQQQTQQPLSNSDSFITRRWERINKSGIPTEGRMRQSIHTFKAKKYQFFMKFTPAYWAFWLGFICPILWLIGGWHFTNFGEQPPKMSAWGFYFSSGIWKEMLCCCCFGMRRRKVPLVTIGAGAGKGKRKEGPNGDNNVGKARRESTKSRLYPPLPKWVAEKQSTDDGRAKLNDPKRSMRGISFGYPFIPRLVMSPSRNESNPTNIKSLKKRVVGIVTKPNRLLDQMYGVKLREVRGRPESGRRMFDPWIQRCRYAFCYALLIMAIALCTASTYLIVYNTRQLR